jgi:hypothetical protein
MPVLPPDGAHPKLEKADYESRLLPAQYRMRDIAMAYYSQGLRGVIVIEGGDTAGKGGAIRRLTAELKSILGPDFPSQVAKVIDHIDDHCRAWIERTPFVVIASVGANGMMDISPKGDPAGFVQVLDPKTLAVPDRLGNHRGDTFLNVLENPNVALMFVIPKRREWCGSSARPRWCATPTCWRR